MRNCTCNKDLGGQQTLILFLFLILSFRLTRDPFHSQVEERKDLTLKDMGKEGSFLLSTRKEDLTLSSPPFHSARKGINGNEKGERGSERKNSSVRRELSEELCVKREEVADQDSTDQRVVYDQKSICAARLSDSSLFSIWFDVQ